jgi:hypothetical protein
MIKKLVSDIIDDNMYFEAKKIFIVLLNNIAKLSKIFNYVNFQKIKLYIYKITYKIYDVVDKHFIFVF